MSKGAELGGVAQEEKGKQGAGDSYSDLKSKKNSHRNLVSANSDDNLTEILRKIKTTKFPAVINYGASWCGVCSQILPTFFELSGKFPKLSFVYADIDECPETTKHIRYTPTFHFYRDGERVDEMFGVGEDRLQDRLWLHS
ncbi:thioredoxin-like 3-3 [Dorcoceras hygrometricum]|uniref:Thioredoxin-like 3-3 n=1 Tax=Dorcoceras hygrometricum TaxID=472368 RepID=A0A2Z7AE24_9LAMI|nr:thioredoxin-like 3-3 [Dorcoceras hygrometricum]